MEPCRNLDPTGRCWRGHCPTHPFVQATIVEALAVRAETIGKLSCGHPFIADDEWNIGDGYPCSWFGCASNPNR